MDAISMHNITKYFGDIRANHNVTVKIKKNTIHAIIGENGAGKTTIMKILYGMYQQDQGEIFVNEKPVKITSPLDALKHKIFMVHQHFMFIDNLSVIENLILGNEITKSFGRLDMKAALDKFYAIAERFNIQIDPQAIIEDFSVGEQQQIEILKALYRGCEILILDEPTAVLTPLEVKEFFKTLAFLKKQGQTIIIITHKLDEVMNVSEEVTVMRNGEKIDTIETKNATPQILAGMMVGRDVLLKVEKSAHDVGDVLLEVKNLSLRSAKTTLLNDINLTIRKGEILGIAGVAGNGQVELTEVLSGMKKPSSGEILINGELVTRNNPQEMRQCKLSHIPSDREKYAYLKSFNNIDNLALGHYYKKSFSNTLGWLNKKNLYNFAKENIEKFNVQPPELGAFTEKLSGGNKQKLIIARELSQNADLIIIAEPTRGVDIASIEFIHQTIIDLRNDGKAILLVSAELSEIINLSDRAVIMYEGSFNGEIQLDQINEVEIGLLMAGKKSA